ncbi:hypothetical protein ACP70R_016334 [Stipagrostis hirtigluma subsp. patula]
MVSGESFGEVTGAAEAAEEERKGPKVVDAEEASVYRKEEVEDEDRVEEAAVDTKVAEDARVDETGMEAEGVDEEDPVEVEQVDDEASDEEQGANAANGMLWVNTHNEKEDYKGSYNMKVNEPDGYPDEVENEDGNVDHLNDEGDIGASVSDDAENAEVDRSIFIVDLDAVEVLDKFNDGTEVKGKKVRVSASQDNNTLYLGNICKTWTKDQVKTVYLEHVPLSWDEEKIEECCKEHGEIKKIIIFRKLKRSKKKDICFVEFCSRDSALACVEGINNGRIGDGIVKVVASLARPVCKGRLAKQGTRGGYKVNNSTTVKGTDQPEHKKAPEDEVIVKKNALHKLPKGVKSKHVYRDSTEVRKASQHYKGKRQARGTKRTFVNERPAKKARKERDVPVKCSKSRYIGGFGSATGAYRVQPPTGPQYASIYQDFSHACASGSNAHSNDLEPHAGYIPATNHVQCAYDWRIAAYHSPQTIVPYYDRGPPRPAYAAHANYTSFQFDFA